MPDKKGSECVFFPELRSSCIEICPDFLHRQICQVDGTDFASFSADAELACVEVDGGLVESSQFRDTQTGGINALDNRRVAFSLNRARVDLLENAHDFSGIQKCHFAIFLFDEIHRYRIDGFVSGLAAELQKSPESDHIRVRRLDGESLFRYMKPKLI